jgi:hypothetical protein
MLHKFVPNFHDKAVEAAKNAGWGDGKNWKEEMVKNCFKW